MARLARLGCVFLGKKHAGADKQVGYYVAGFIIFDYAVVDFLAAGIDFTVLRACSVRASTPIPISRPLHLL